MLFYVNVQNKTKYEYKGLRKWSSVPVGGQVKTFVKGSDAVPQLGYDAVPGKFKYNNELREAGLVTDVEYQKQMIRNGGRGNIHIQQSDSITKR